MLVHQYLSIRENPNVVFMQRPRYKLSHCNIVALHNK